MQNFISIRSQWAFNKEDYAIHLYIQSVPAKMLSTSRGGCVYLDGSESHQNTRSDTPS